MRRYLLLGRRRPVLLFPLLLGTLFLLSLPLCAAPLITVSASSMDILGNNQRISITVDLVDPNNTGLLRVNGANIIPIMTASSSTPGNTATVGPIYGNDVIRDGFGNLNATYYRVRVFTVINSIISSTAAFQQFFAFTGAGTVDLATATPVAPSFMTGTNGSVTIPGALTVSGAATFSPPIPVASGGTNSTTALGARTSLAVPGLADNNTFTGSNLFVSSGTCGPVALATVCTAGGTATTGGIDVYSGQFGVTASERFFVNPTTGNVNSFNLHIQPISGGLLNGTDSITLSSSGLISTYNSTTTAGQGISWIPCSTSQKTETAADASLLTCPILAQAGSYRIRFVMSVSAANAATLGWTATWIDSNGNAQIPTNLALTQSGVAAPALTFTTSVAGDYYGYADIDVNNAGTSPVVKLTFTGTSFTAKVSATVERII